MRAVVAGGGTRPRLRQASGAAWRGAAVGLVLAATGCAGPEEEAAEAEPAPEAGAEQEVAFEVLARGDRPAADVGPNAVGVRIIESTEDFARAHRALVGGEAPVIDFDRSAVLALDMGRQPTGGYGIEVESVVRTEGKLIVRVAAIEPGPTCLTTQAFTRPYQLVRVPVREGEPIEIERRSVERDCG